MKFNRKYFILLLILLSNNHIFSAQIKPQTSNEKAGIEIIEKNLSIIKNNITYKTDSIKTLTYKTLNLSKLLNYQNGILNSYYYLGRFFYLSNCSDSAMYFYKVGLEIAKKNKSELVTSFYTGIANIFWDKGDFSGGLESALKAKRYFESEGIIDEKYEIFNYLGLYYEGLFEYESALENYKRSSEIAIKKNENGYAGIVFANTGRVYNKLMNYDTAIIFFKKGVALEVENNLLRNAGRSYSSLATVFLNLNMLDSSKTYIEKALNCNTLVNDSTGLVRTFIAYSKYYIKRNDYTRSTEIINKAIPIAIKFQNKSELVELYKLLAENYYQSGNYKESTNYYIKYIESYQQIFDIKKINQVSALEHQLKSTQQENEINLLKIEKQNSVKNNLLVIAILLFLISGLAIAFVIYFKKINQKLLDQNFKISEQMDIVEELNKQLILAEENISKVDELKSNFINILSHEIRTPLNGIVGFSSLMVDSEISNEEKVEASNIIRKNSDELISTIEGLVDLSLIKSDQLFVFKEEIDLYSFLTRLHNDVLNIRNNLFKDHIEIQFIPDQKYSSYLIRTDTNLLRKSLTKLINNAIKFTSKGKVDYGFTISNNSVSFFIADTGIGIPEESQQNIFNQFEKGKNVPKNTGGLGISLTLANKYIELLGGKISYESTINKGTKFHFEIPIQ